MYCVYVFQARPSYHIDKRYKRIYQGDDDDGMAGEKEIRDVDDDDDDDDDDEKTDIEGDDRSTGSECVTLLLVTLS